MFRVGKLSTGPKNPVNVKDLSNKAKGDRLDDCPQTLFMSGSTETVTGCQIDPIEMVKLYSIFVIELAFLPGEAEADIAAKSRSRIHVVVDGGIADLEMGWRCGGTSIRTGRCYDTRRAGRLNAVDEAQFNLERVCVPGKCRHRPYNYFVRRRRSCDPGSSATSTDQPGKGLRSKDHMSSEILAVPYQLHNGLTAHWTGSLIQHGAGQRHGFNEAVWVTCGVLEVEVCEYEIFNFRSINRARTQTQGSPPKGYCVNKSSIPISFARNAPRMPVVVTVPFTMGSPEAA